MKWTNNSGNIDGIIDDQCNKEMYGLVFELTDSGNVLSWVTIAADIAQDLIILLGAIMHELWAISLQLRLIQNNIYLQPGSNYFLHQSGDVLIWDVVKQR